MSGYLTKLVVIFAISAVGAGVHLGASWPVKLKSEPAEPPTWTPDEDDDPAPETPDEDAPSDDGPDAGGAAQDEPSGDEPLVLDGLEIDLDQARQLHERGLATFVDARPADRYEAGHIADAMHITPQMLDDTSLFVLDVIDPDKPIVIYCDGGDCDDSHRVAELLQQLRGLELTYVFVDGYPAWEAAGLPTGTGPDPWAE